MRFILASQSPARLSVLRAAGIDPLVRVSGVDEDAVAANYYDSEPSELVGALAAAKAEAVVAAVAEELPDSVVVACDSMLAVDTDSGREVVSKPGTPQRARERWHGMAGRAGELLTGHAVTRLRDGASQSSAQGTRTTTVRFAAPEPAELDAYLDTGEPLGVAGGFTLDGFGGWFVDGVDGDPSSVLGISLPLTRDLLGKVGVRIVDLWRTAG